MSQTNSLLLEISSKLDKVLRLLALNVVKDYGKEQQKIELLDSLGFRPVEIAKLFNKSPENISVVLGTLRKKKEPISKKAEEKGIHKAEAQQVKPEGTA
jgi:cell division protein ZapA (FtsZ GTPase activity inhibitor)